MLVRALNIGRHVKQPDRIHISAETMRSPKVSFLFCACMLVGCSGSSSLGSPYTGADVGNLVLSPTRSVADGASLVRVSASIPLGSQANPRIITFVTDAGTFIASGSETTSVSVNSSGAASALLRAPSFAVMATVAASAGQSTVDSLLPFDTAFAQSIALQTSAPAIRDTGTVPITVMAVLRRGSGIVTPGELVTFSVSAGQVGAPTLSDSTGLSQVTFTAYGVPPGLVTITATVANTDSTTVSGSVTIQVIQ
jgi:hypothetical protein